MKIAILGSGGRLGTALARTYAREHEIFAFNHSSLDLGSSEAIAAALEPLGFDVLINCAALTNVDYCETHEVEANRINGEAVREIGEICSRKRVRCIHISTDYVFDGEQREPYRETDAPRPVSIYGASKLLGEEALFSVSDQHLAVRVSWVFGPDRPSFIDQILKRALETDQVAAIGDKWSAPSYTVDLAEMLRPFLAGVKTGGILHACNAGECTWREYGEYAIRCAAEAGMPVKTQTVGSLKMADMKNFVAQRPVYTVLATDKIAGFTGQPPRTWQAAVEHFVTTHCAAQARTQ